MLQVRCPSCRRLLDVPEGSERATAVCPGCHAAFVPAGGAHETAVTAGRPVASRSDTGIQKAPSTPQPLHRKRRRRTNLVSIELASGLTHHDFQIAAKVFFVACLLGMATVAGLGEASDLPIVLPFAIAAAVHAVMYRRVARGFRGDGREAYFWFYVVGSVLYIGGLAMARLLDSSKGAADLFIGFLLTPLAGTLIGLMLWAIVILSGVIVLRGRLRRLMFETLLPEAYDDPSADEQLSAEIDRRRTVDTEQATEAPPTNEETTCDPHAIKRQ